MLVACFAIADIHDFSNLDAVRIPDGTAALPGLILQSEGESDPEGEQEGLYRSAEGEEGVGVTVNGVSIGKILSTGWNGAVVGTDSFPAGSAAAPSIYPTGDTNTGIYSSGADTINITTGGTLRLSLSTSLFTNTLPYSFPLGAAGTPSLYPGTDSNTGIYSAGADTLNFTTGGTLRLSLTTTELTNTLPYVMPLGAAATPSIYPTGDDNTGLYSAGADILNMTTGGTLRLSLSTSALTSTLPIYAPDGAATTPSITFASDTDLGLYRVSANTMGVYVGTGAGMYFNSIYLQSLLQHIFAVGSVATPSITFAGDTNTGIYSAGEDTINITTGGVLIAHVDTATIVLDDTVWQDASIGALTLETGGTLPGVVEWLDNDGDATGIYTRGFAVDDQGSGVITIPHDYKEGTDITPYICWGTINAPSGTDYVQWQMTYTVAQEGTTLADSVAITKETAVDTQYETMRSNFTAITGTAFNIGDQFVFTIKRIAAVGDAFAGEALAHSIGFAYEVDTIGSRTISTK